MSMNMRIARWVGGSAAAVVVYAIVIWLLPQIEGGVPGLSPRLVVLNATLLATAAAVSVGGLTIPRNDISFARKFFFFAGLLTPIGRAVYEFLRFHTISHDYLAMLGGAFAGGMLGLFILILPKPEKARQPRRFT
jgi:hypothetical protein